VFFWSVDDLLRVTVHQLLCHSSMEPLDGFIVWI
jgi:hypothetical protein